jgi:DNA-binding PadR family transcriptional regulator
MFDTAALRLVLLHFLEKEPRHGYDLIREIEELTGGAYAPSPGIVYPTLTMLEEQGYAEAVSAEGSKRLFKATAQGQAYLAERRAEADNILARLKSFGTGEGGVDVTPVRRAVQNLRAILIQKLSRGADKAMIFEAVDLIDEAARKIERLEPKAS